MKLFFVIFVSALALSATEPQAKKKAATQTPQAAPKAAAPKVTDGSKPMPIPAGAVVDAEGDYHYTDAEGKKWTYRKTPFGVVRLDDSAERAAAKTAVVNGLGITATENGDKVHFERKGPFGVWKWDKKKSELDETEQAALRNSQSNDKTASKQD